MLAKPLADKLAKDPNNGDGWLLLARTYREIGQHKDALEGYERAATLLPHTAEMLAEWVDARVIANDRKWDDPTRAILKEALKLDAKSTMVLSLAGSEAFDRGDNKAAISYWEKISKNKSADPMDIKLAEENIKSAKLRIK